MDFGAFGDWWDLYIGNWWNTLDWGNVPAWVGSILTSVSVFLAINILRADRKAKRLAPAEAFATWHFWSFADSTELQPSWTIKAHAFNTGDAPIPFAMIGARRLTLEYEIQLFKKKGNNDIATIEPKEHIELDIQYDFNPNIKLFYVRFKDAKGKEWIRMLASGRYMSERRFNRWDKGAWWDRVKKVGADRAAAKAHNTKSARSESGAGR